MEQFDDYLRERLKVEGEKNSLEQLKQKDSLASEVIKELSKDNKRKDFIIGVLIATILIIVGMFLWYLNQPGETVTETTYTQEMNATTEGDNSAITQHIGG